MTTSTGSQPVFAEEFRRLPPVILDVGKSHSEFSVRKASTMRTACTVAFTSCVRMI